jgi:hypothetical protein
MRAPSPSCAVPEGHIPGQDSRRRLLIEESKLSLLLAREVDPI